MSFLYIFITMCLAEEFLTGRIGLSTAPIGECASGESRKGQVRSIG